MKSKMFKKIMAASLATAMTASLAGCAKTEPTVEPSSSEAESTVEESSVEESSEEEVGQVTILTDADGNVYDLGGMEIVIRNWWARGDEPTNAYEEAVQEYRDWIQETYNFTIREENSLEWGDPATEEFTNYVSTNGDDANYVFTLTPLPSTTSAMSSGMMYDLSTLDCLDFSEEKFQKNKVHELYSKGGSIYAMATGAVQPRGGIFFNKRLLEEANIDPNSIYDMQANGTWTWDAFEDICKQVHRDTNNDGEIDVYAVNCNDSNLTNEAVFSNGGNYVGMQDGKYVLMLEDPKTMEALEWTVKIMDNYWEQEPEGAEWDYYKQSFVNGNYVFMPEESYVVEGDFIADMQDDFGFVMFPKGPQMDDYTNVPNENLFAIPSCYDAEKAWKIAFAYNLYTNDAPGYEDYEGWKDTMYNNFRDERAVDETYAMMREKTSVAYDTVIPSLDRGSELTWNIWPGCDIAATVEAIKDTWQSYVDAANK